jgi:hypothetical protein
MYKYYCTGRPAMPGTIPKENLVSIQNLDTRQQFHFCKAWAIVTYSEPLDKRTLNAYELSENKPEPDQFIELEKIDPIVFFRGTEKEQAAEEKKEERNKKWLKALYKETLSGNIDYFYTRKETANGYENFKVIHKSAKYKDGLQLTALSFLNGEFAYMTYDVLIADFKRLESELCITGGKIYFGNLETI